MALARRATREASTQFRAFVSRASVAPRVSNASVVAPRPMGTSPGARARGGARGTSTSRDATSRASETTEGAIREMFRHDNAAMTRARMLRALPGWFHRGGGGGARLVRPARCLLPHERSVDAQSAGGRGSERGGGVSVLSRRSAVVADSMERALRRHQRVLGGQAVLRRDGGEAVVEREERALYAKHFAHMPMHEFKTLIRHGEWREVERGFEFTREGRANTHVYVPPRARRMCSSADAR